VEPPTELDPTTPEDPPLEDGTVEVPPADEPPLASELAPPDELAGATDELLLTPEEPPVAPEEPPVTPEEPPVTPEDPPVTPEDPPVTPEEPPVTPEEPPVTPEEPPPPEELPLLSPSGLEPMEQLPSELASSLTSPLASRTTVEPLQ